MQDDSSVQFSLPQRVILAVSAGVLIILMAGLLWMRLQPETPSEEWGRLNSRLITQVEKQDYGGAIHSGRLALSIARELFPENDLRRAVSAENLAEALRRSGDFEAALPLLEEGLVVRREIENSAPDALITPLNNLACLNEDIFQYEAAEKYYHEALRLAESTHGVNGRITAIVMRNMARLYNKMIGRDEEAKELSARADAVLGPLETNNLTPRF